MEKFFSILLSFMLMASHVYLTIGTHYCGGEAVETKLVLGETNLSCGMSEMDESCDEPEEPNKHDVCFDKLPCCANEYQTVQLTDEFVKDTDQTSVNVDFTAAFLATSLNLNLFSKSTLQLYTDNSPPPLEKDFQLLFQTFLI